MHFDQLPLSAGINIHAEPESQGVPGEWLSDDWLTGFDLSADLGTNSSTSLSPIPEAVDGALNTFNNVMGETATHYQQGTALGHDHTEAHIERLAELIICIGRSARAISTSTSSRTPLSASSPLFNEICVSTSSLISLLNRVIQPCPQEGVADSMSLELDSQLGLGGFYQANPEYSSRTKPQPQSLAVSPNTGVLMMILACYQQLLVAFENICLSMHQHLQAMEITSQMGFSQQQRLLLFSSTNQHNESMSPLPEFVPSTTIQFVMMIKLISDLLNRLDRALEPLTDGTVGENQEPDNPTILIDKTSEDTSSDSSSLDSTRTTTLKESHDESSKFLRRGSIARRPDGDSGSKYDLWSNAYRVAVNSAETMQHRQRKLRARLRVVKRLVRSQDI